MTTANLELCKELYELSGWEPPKVGDHYLIWKRFQKGNFPSLTLVFGSDKSHICPTYDLGYLLRKLPNEVTSKKIGGYHYFYLHHGKNSWVAYFGQDATEFIADSDSPENAVAQLAIQLIKAGILSGKENNEH